MLVFEKMTIYLFGKVQLQRKSRHFLMRARYLRVKLCPVGMRNAILENNLKLYYTRARVSQTQFVQTSGNC